MTNQTDLKKKELERLLEENKIGLPQYLEMAAKLEAPLSVLAKETSSENVKHRGLLKTDALLFVSPLLIAFGWFIDGLNQVQGYDWDTTSHIGPVGYPYSLVGTGVIMVATILLCTGLAYRFVKSVSRGGLIVSQVAGWPFIVIALYVFVTGFSGVYVQDSATSWHTIASIDPFISAFGLVFWFTGTLTIAYGLVSSRRWLNKSIS